MAELFISGQIESADGFGDNRVSCRWQLQMGGGWRVVQGETEGQTQTDLPSVYEEAFFGHPIDLHLATNTIQGWPRLTLQMWHHDHYSRQDIAGYGTVFLPTTSGSHEVRKSEKWLEHFLMFYMSLFLEDSRNNSLLFEKIYLKVNENP
ncbi:unnamed protein product [Caenorhabditis auriculariae]|uniref:B9 domain-containing protein 2 n=1 Tax=Caenorhabditis auriculariae TaxID=2777116 RepID=A0A8S1H5V3_9PELO|nr:unnamed protein product [Caenorhabditis auriculariae]